MIGGRLFPLPDLETTIMLLGAAVVVDVVVVPGNLSRSVDEFTVDVRVILSVYGHIMKYKSNQNKSKINE